MVSIFFYFHPYLGKLSNLTNIFQMGWNHQPTILSPVLGGTWIVFPTLLWRWLPRKWQFCSLQLRFLRQKLTPNAQPSSLGLKALVFFLKCVSFLVIFYTALCCVTVSIYSFWNTTSFQKSKHLKQSKIVERWCSGRLELQMANLRIGRILRIRKLI